MRLLSGDDMTQQRPSGFLRCLSGYDRELSFSLREGEKRSVMIDVLMHSLMIMLIHHLRSRLQLQI